jgi:hypothetical protein
METVAREILRMRAVLHLLIIKYMSDKILSEKLAPVL